MFYSHKNGISFRKLQQSDLACLKDLKDESWFGTVHTACLNTYDQNRWFEKISDDASCLYLIAFLHTEPIGLYGIVDIDPISRSCSFTHSVYKNFRGRGLGKLSLQAGIDCTFEVFNMRRIDTWILENNLAELRAATAAKLVEEGVKREAVYKCGQYLDCKLLAILRKDWEGTQRRASLDYVCNTTYQPKSSPK